MKRGGSVGTQGDLAGIGGQVGLGVVLGFAVGYTAKKALRILLVVAGILILCQLLLQDYGVISIHWQTIEKAYNDGVMRTGGFNKILRLWAESVGAYLPVAGSFVFGFIFGFRKG